MSDAQSFEASLAQLEQIIETLESGELSLEETLTLFEQAKELAVFCEEALNKAELRLEELRTPDQDMPDSTSHDAREQV